MNTKKIIHFFSENTFTVVLVGITYGVAILLAVFFVITSITRLTRVAEERLASETNTFLALTSEHFNGGVSILHALQGFYSGSEEVTRPEFYQFISSSNFIDIYPGFSTVSYIKRVTENDKELFLTSTINDKSTTPNGYPLFAITPAGMRDEYWPIVYIYPEKDVELLLGSDQRSEPIRAQNITIARDSGMISVSKMVELVQGGTGVIIAAPLYDEKTIPDSISARRQLFSGAVTTVIEFDRFFDSVLPHSNIIEKNISVSISNENEKITPFHATSPSKTFFTGIYGTITREQQLTLENSDPYNFVFTVSMSDMLTNQELSEPLVYIVIFVFAGILVSLVIILLQRAKKLSDVKKNYAFISTLSHQLRTPLTRLRWIIESSTTSSDHKREHKDILKEVTILQSIIGSLLLYIELSEKIKIRPKTLFIEQISIEIEKLITHHHHQKRIKIITEKVNGKISGDIDKLSLAIMNVINNALTYSPKKNRIYIRLSAQKSMLYITITDQGYGIPKKEQRRIFEPFFRASNASLGKNAGSGVSLFIAKKIIETHGGVIRFNSVENEGSVFTITLPLL